jgi:DNA-3-methyladenine glycosylase I
MLNLITKQKMNTQNQYLRFLKLTIMKKIRCHWVTDDPLYIIYHDEEWGRPVYDDRKLFEFLILESFQAGLSWLTILRKRENFRRAFDNFDYQKIARYDEEKLEKLRQDAGIIRNRLKIRAARTNALAYIKVQKEFGSFADYLWAFVNHKPIINYWPDAGAVPARTGLSDKISKDLKKRGFTFTGSTIIYAYMQAVGLVNDHEANCFLRPEEK